MSQSKQLKKVKLYRVLKVVFYFLGLPLFLFAVFCTTFKFLGNPPYIGYAPFFTNLNALIPVARSIAGPGFYGFWCAFGVWLLISICHLVLAKTVKSRRARMFAVLALVLVVMVGGTFLMDAVFESKINDIRASAPAGVTVDDYKTQLSYYTYVSADRKAGTAHKLRDQVRKLMEVYNIEWFEWFGDDRGGVAGNIANKPADYYNIISDPYQDENGEWKIDVGVDISFRQSADGVGYELAIDENNNIVKDNSLIPEVEGNQLVRIAPNGNGQLVINGRLYSHYSCVSRKGMNGTTTYLWYCDDMQPFKANGVYGAGKYNKNGMLGDGWVFSMENVLNILEDYYEGQQEIAALQKKYSTGRKKYADYVADINKGAAKLRDDYYNMKAQLSVVRDENGEIISYDQADMWTKELYNQEVTFTENFSLTRGELEYLLSNVGALLGDNSLFDWLFTSDDVNGLLGGISDLVGGDTGLGSILGPALDNLATGKFNLGQFITDPSTMGTVVDWVKKLTGREDEIKDIYVVLVYKNIGKPDQIVEKDHLYLALYKDNGEGAIDATDAGRLLDIDFDDGLLEGGDDDEFNFDLDRLSAFLNNALNTVLDNFGINLKEGIINTILGLVLKDINVTVGGKTEVYKGLVISGISIPLINSKGEIDIDVNNILTGLLQNWYFYQSPVIKPVWEFYEEYAKSRSNANEALREIAPVLAKYERSVYEGSAFGSMIGSTLIGDSLGAGAYASSFGLTDLNSVRQLQTDLSYQPVYFPLFSFRDIMLAFSGIVMLFYFLSFVAAEKEELYATGKLLGKVTKKDLEKELEGAPASPVALPDSLPKATEEKPEAKPEPAAAPVDIPDYPEIHFTPPEPMPPAPTQEAKGEDKPAPMPPAPQSASENVAPKPAPEAGKAPEKESGPAKPAGPLQEGQLPKPVGASQAQVANKDAKPMPTAGQIPSASNAPKPAPETGKAPEKESGPAKPAGQLQGEQLSKPVGASQAQVANKDAKPMPTAGQIPSASNAPKPAPEAGKAPEKGNGPAKPAGQLRAGQLPKPLGAKGASKVPVNQNKKGEVK